jgi:hypothetical protein
MAIIPNFTVDRKYMCQLYPHLQPLGSSGSKALLAPTVCDHDSVDRGRCLVASMSAPKLLDGLFRRPRQLLQTAAEVIEE